MTNKSRLVVNPKSDRRGSTVLILKQLTCRIVEYCAKHAPPYCTVEHISHSVCYPQTQCHVHMMPSEPPNDAEQQTFEFLRRLGPVEPNITL